MERILALSVSLFLIVSSAFSQEATAVHEINKGAEPNEYIVKTIVSGLKGVDIARATYKIDDAHAYQKVAGNELFSSRNKDYIKFYVMGVPEAGVITIELGLTLANNGSYSFPVEFQYSRNDEKKIVQFSDLVFTGEELLATTKSINETEKLEEKAASSNMETSTLASPTTTNGSVSTAAKPIEKELVAELVDTFVVEKEATIKEELADTKVKYTIQLLSLSKFSKARFDEYCDEHSLLPEEVSTRVVNGMTKVIYGKAKSLEEAKKLIDRLKLLNNVDGAFAVPL